MNLEPKNEKDRSQTIAGAKNNLEIESEQILCPHCKRTASNGIKCKGICVADNDY